MRVLLILLCVLVPALARADICPPPPSQPVLNLTISQDPPQPNNAFNIPQLRDLTTQQNPALAASGRHVPLGLTQVNARYNASMDATQIALGDGAYCTYVKSITLDIRLADTTVYVATELPRDSCIYREVLDHENHHVQVDTIFVNDWRNRLPGIMQGIINSVGTIRTRDAQSGADQISNRIKPQIEPLYRQMLDDRAQRQARVDTPAEYSRVSNSCNGELRRYLPAGLR